MRTLIIRIDLADGSQRYPVRLYLEDPARADWQQTPIAVGAMDAGEFQEPVGPIAANACPPPCRYRKFLLEKTTRSTLFTEMGAHLFQLLAQGDIGAKWDEIRGQYEARSVYGNRIGIGLRTILDIRPDALRPIPWELLIADEKFLFSDPLNPFLRGRNDFQIQPPPLRWPVRALIVIGMSERDNEYAQAKNEAIIIQDIFKTIGKTYTWKTLELPSRDELMASLRQWKPQILHFIGHGTIGDAGKPRLQIQNSASADASELPSVQWNWASGDIMQDIRDIGLHFVCLNACRSGTVEDREKLLSLTDAFLRAGVPAVVGMQADIRSDTAVCLAKALYQAFVDGSPADVALTQARRAIADRLGWDQREWCLPALYVNVRPDELLSIHYELPEAQRQAILNEDDFRKVRGFVNREPQRDTMIQRLDTAAGEISSSSLLTVLGESDYGKTWLILWALELCALRGHRVVYVDLDSNTLDAIETIRRIKNPSLNDPPNIQPPYIRRKLEEHPAFNAFNFALNAYLRNRLPVGEAPPDTKDDRTPFSVEAEQHLPKIFALFCATLVEVAAERPLVIVLDRPNPVEYVAKEHLRKGLIDPIAKGQLPHVKMVLAMNRTEYDRFDFEGRDNNLVGRMEKIELKPLDGDCFKKYALEFFRFQSENCPPDKKHRIEMIIDAMNNGCDWIPSKIRDIKGLVDRQL